MLKNFVIMAMLLAGGTLFPSALCLADIGMGPGPEYKRQCIKPANPTAICAETKPLYIGSGLPEKGSHPLPPDVIRKLGFIQPGTTYVQRGFVVYLITLPRHIILDNVSAKDPESSGIQWR